MMHVPLFSLVLTFVVPFLLLKSLGGAIVKPSEPFTSLNLLNSNDIAQSPRILLLTAHPDDEALFFAPTILGLTNRNAELHLMCLSNGDADGTGHLRSEEIENSWDVLGVDPKRRVLIDSPLLQDNITMRWNASIISGFLAPYVQAHNIDIILTFDAYGISRHPNHGSLPYGVVHYLKSLSDNTSTKNTNPQLFTLISVPLLPKYFGPISVVLAKFDLLVAHVMQTYVWPAITGEISTLSSLSSNIHDNDADTSYASSSITLFISDITRYSAALKAMRQHKSQMVWFRWLNVAFSRYMWVNEWMQVII